MEKHTRTIEQGCYVSHQGMVGESLLTTSN